MNIDDLIKKSLRDNMQRIDDPDFTQNIIDASWAKKTTEIVRPFVGFNSLILGMICLIGSAGILFLYSTHTLPAGIMNFDTHTGVILVTLSVTFLLYNLLTEITMKYPRGRNTIDQR